MLRSRILAAATAAVLLLGMSVGGAGAALAVPGEGGGPPAPHPEGGATKVTVCHATPPDTAAEGWNLLSIDDDAAATNQSGHDQEHDADIIEAFTYWHKVGTGSDATWEERTYPGKNLSTDFGGVSGATILANGCAKPVVEVPVASASISTLAATCDDPTQFNFDTDSVTNASWGTPVVDGGVITIVATATGGALFAAGDGVSGDRTTKTFSAAYAEAGGENCGPPEVSCVVVVWQMPGWVNGTAPTWPQDFVAVYPFECGDPVDAPVPDICGTQYQLDKYYDSDITDALIAGGFLNGPNNPDEDLVPGGWGNSYKLVKNPDCELATAAIAVVERDCFVATSLDTNDDVSDNVTWGDVVIDVDAETISITATADGDARFEEGLEGVSDDRTQRVFTAPYQEAGGDDCVAPSIDVVASFTALTCDPDSGAYAAGLFNADDPNGDKLLWTTTAGTVPSATANTVSEPGVVTVTVRVANAHLGDFAVNETSSLGTVSIISVDGIETALITWTFTFTEPDDCELGSVVVPIVTYEDYCEGVGPNALRVATFTVTNVENASYSYTVNGGAPIAVTFGDEETVTIAVNALDNVVVTATPAEGFELNEGYEPWSHSFIGAAFCPGTFPATEAAADITPADCEGSPVMVTLTNEGGVIWTLNGDEVDGNMTHELAPGSAVNLTAELESPSEEFPGGWTWSDPEQQTAWTEAGTSDEDCLSSLAFTGADSASAWLGGAAVLMMLVGMGAVVLRRRVEI